MTMKTPAGRLVSSFGDVAAMKALYSPDIAWTMQAVLGLPRPMKGYDAVVAFNEQVWAVHHRPDCKVTILDECGDDRSSAVRFIYRAHHRARNAVYENEYTVFVRSDEGGIREVFEGMDTAFLADFLGARQPGQSIADVTGGALAEPASYSNAT